MNVFDVMMVALRFNEKINARDLEGLTVMMTPDHTFIDSSDKIHQGKAVMEKGWQDFFASYPDYQNIFTQVQVENDVVVMVGYSTFSYDPLDGPALWSAKIRDWQVSEWRVYKDTPKNRKTLGICTAQERISGRRIQA